MSSNSHTYSTFQSSSYSTYTDSSGTKSQHIHSNPSGTIVTTVSEPVGEQPTTETTEYPRGATATQLGGSSDKRRIEDVTDKGTEQADADRQYEERMEDEYAKREGGA